MQISFFGAAGTVTGSKHLVTSGNRRVLVDCGLFQGLKVLRLKNWARFPIDPATIDAVVLTHAHIDHTGYLPLLVRQGFRGKVYCSEVTLSLCQLLLRDSAHLQEEEARYANKRGYSKHKPALPLYTKEDAEAALEHLVPLPVGRDVQILDGITVKLQLAGHILGACTVLLKDEQTSILFSGDLGRMEDPLLFPPAPPEAADYLVVESTYGNRLHEKAAPEAQLAEVINRTVKRGGSVLVPVFAVGRAQEVLYYIHKLKQAGAIPADIPVYLNSPMAVDATLIFLTHHAQHKLDAAQCRELAKVAKVVSTVEESMSLNELREPAIILAASGMASGGRVVHHLKALGPDPRNTVLFAGFQAAGTRGAALLDGAESVKIHGEYVPMRAEIASIDNLSAHADYQEIMQWLSQCPQPPKQTFIVHGEPVAADALRHRIEEERQWNVMVPEYLQTVELDGK
ncbi:MBL fold metallo-hydrolase RNA specificity domain-containing protein [Methylobacillus flagellatus]|uniref:Beta-lactamase-like protein n=1 Tax=Methylobacillus flagellatus (strain ATCC 51484 / DSM 6875 / VKM B-1610 / KT) TaxID=265072 RepID=Q1H1I7_METFK|nr:MBL fold metallo-hydrolase [Methylobacillus flagellatus]ABE49650.1 beta-lactamase-like protein [Methylobacillus flagellatus KT]